MRWLTMKIVVLVAAAHVGGCGFDPSPAMPRPPGPISWTRQDHELHEHQLPAVDVQDGQLHAARLHRRRLTRLTGTVYDPAGKVPLYNINVFVPNKPLAPYTTARPATPATRPCRARRSCGPRPTRRAASRWGTATNDVPVGREHPAGDPGRQVAPRDHDPATSPACADTALTDPNMTRLPRNQSEGHMPKIALTTGGADALECLLRKIGIDDAEFTPSGQRAGEPLRRRGRDDKFNARSAAPTSRRAPWWDDVANLRKYDMILHSCEGGEPDQQEPRPRAQALQDVRRRRRPRVRVALAQLLVRGRAGAVADDRQLQPPGGPGDPVHRDHRHQLPQGAALAQTGW